MTCIDGDCQMPREPNQSLCVAHGADTTFKVRADIEEMLRETLRNDEEFSADASLTASVGMLQTRAVLLLVDVVRQASDRLSRE